MESGIPVQIVGQCGVADKSRVELLQFGAFITQHFEQHLPAEQLNPVEKRKSPDRGADQRLRQRNHSRLLPPEQRPPRKQFDAAQHGEAEVDRQMGARLVEVPNPPERRNQEPHTAPEHHRPRLILHHGLAPAPEGEKQPGIGILRNELAATGSIEKIAEFQMKAVAQRQKIVPQCVHNPLLS